MDQLDLFSDPFLGENPTLWTPRDIWVRLSQRVLEFLGEDRRFERKGVERVHFDDLATYLSTFSNTPDGGLIVYGIGNKGKIIGCNRLSLDQLNRIESCHVELCPLAKPEHKRIPVVVNGKQDFCYAIFIPYIGRLVETNKGEAYIRYGESRHLMSEEEKRDFRATRQELSFEEELASYTYPDDFDLLVIQDFCDGFRLREGRAEWSNNEILVDRHLLRKDKGALRPTNALVLLAALDPRRTIPGCRVRVQRFAGTQEGTGNEYNPIRDRFIEGNLNKIIREADETISGVIYDVNRPGFVGGSNS